MPSWRAGYGHSGLVRQGSGDVHARTCAASAKPPLHKLSSQRTPRWRGESAANSSRKSNSRAAPQWVDSTGIAVERLFWARTGNNRTKTQHFRHFWMSISRLSIARARARERQVFRARAESPNARRRDKRADRPFAKIKKLFTKIMRLS